MHSASSSRTSDAPPSRGTCPGYTKGPRRKRHGSRTLAATASHPAHVPQPKPFCQERTLCHPEERPSIRPASAQIAAQARERAANSCTSGRLRRPASPHHVVEEGCKAPSVCGQVMHHHSQSKSAVNHVAVVATKVIAVVRIDLPNFLVGRAHPNHAQRIAVLEPCVPGRHILAMANGVRRRGTTVGLQHGCLPGRVAGFAARLLCA